MDLLNDPDTRAEVERMMNDPDFRREMEQYTSGADFQAAMKKARKQVRGKTVLFASRKASMLRDADANPRAAVVGR